MRILKIIMLILIVCFPYNAHCKGLHMDNVLVILPNDYEPTVIDGKAYWTTGVYADIKELKDIMNEGSVFGIFPTVGFTFFMQHIPNTNAYRAEELVKRIHKMVFLCSVVQEGVICEQNSTVGQTLINRIGALNTATSQEYFLESLDNVQNFFQGFDEWLHWKLEQDK